MVNSFFNSRAKSSPTRLECSIVGRFSPPKS